MKKQHAEKTVEATAQKSEAQKSEAQKSEAKKSEVRQARTVWKARQSIEARVQKFKKTKERIRGPTWSSETANDRIENTYGAVRDAPLGVDRSHRVRESADNDE